MMKDAIKMYHLFFQRKWMIGFVYILYPLMVIGSRLVYALSGYTTDGAMMVLFLPVLAAELCFDSFILGGIGAADTKMLEYVKTSGKGEHLLEQMLTVDRIRRFITLMIIFLGLYAMDGWNYQIAVEMGWAGNGFHTSGIHYYLQHGLLVYILNELGLCVIRSIKNRWIYLLTIGAGYPVVYTAMILIWWLELYRFIWVTLLLAAFAFAVAVIEKRLVMHGVRRSYYDTGYKKLSKVN